LRASYVENLAGYEGTRYTRGGENRLGIDCSGLVRRGLINALLKQGVATLNPALIRRALVLIWNDSTARALMEEYRGETRQLFRSDSLRELDHTRIRPGDFAVTQDGVHTLTYLGDRIWIEADPGAGRVIRVKASDGNAWLEEPVMLMRWTMLD